jgi:four helix bundle protein
VKRNHRDLRAWQNAMVLVEHVYQITAIFPQSELYGLTSQIRRAAVSVPSNIAEGAARSGAKELRQFLSIAQASLSELDTLVDIAARIGYLKDPASTIERINQLSGLVSRLRSAIRTT